MNSSKPMTPQAAIHASHTRRTGHHLLLCLAFIAATTAEAQTIATYQSIISSQGPMSWFKFDTGFAYDTVITNDVATNSTILTASGTGGVGGWLGGFASDVYRNTKKAIYFGGAGDATEVTPGTSSGVIATGGSRTTTSTNAGTITCLFRTLDNTNNTGRRYVFMAGGDPGAESVNALGLFFEGTNSANPDPNSLRLRLGNETITILATTEIEADSWYYFAFAFTEATNTLDWTGTNAIKGKWYLGRPGGPLNSGLVTNLLDAVAGDGIHFVIGNWTNYSAPLRNPGNGRIDEFASWSRQLSFTEISNQFAALPKMVVVGGTYQEVVMGQVPKYYFKLDNSLDEAVTGTLQLSPYGTEGAFTSDFLGSATKAYSFTETNDALYITNDLINGGGPGVNTAANGSGTISFLFRMLDGTTNEGQRFIFSAPGSETATVDDNQLALFLENPTATAAPNSLKLRVGNTTKGNTGSSSADNNVPVAYANELVPGAWYYFAMTYDESRNTPEVYIYFGKVGGSLTNETMNPANNSVVGNDGWLVLGNKIELGMITNSAFRNPGSGGIDEFAIWHEELSPTEIRAQFAALAPSVAPTLTIAVTGSNVVLSWPTAGSTGYELRSTASLASPSWTSAGVPTVSGNVNYVTNSLAGPGKYYRLEKP